MKIFGKLIQLSGNKITLELDNEANVKRIGTLSDGAVPTVEVDIKDARRLLLHRESSFSRFATIAMIGQGLNVDI